MKLNFSQALGALVISSALFASGARAQSTNLIDVQMFGTSYNGGAAGNVQTGAAVIGNTGDFWNQISPGFPIAGPTVVSAQSLVNVSSNSSPATFTYVQNNASYGGTLPNNNGVNPAAPGDATATAGTKPLYSGSTSQLTFGAGPTTQTFSFNNLSSFIGDTFILDVYAASAQSFTLSGATGGNSSSTLSASATNANISNGAGDAYVQYTGTITGSTLSVVGSWGPGGNWGGAVNGFQLQTVTPPPAASYLWSNAPASSNWSTGANWAGGIAPASSSALVFDASSITNLNNDLTNATNASLTFTSNAPAYTIGGNTLTISGVASGIYNNSTNAQTINLPIIDSSSIGLVTTNNGGNLIINGAISGAGGVTASGAGTTTLTASNSFSGGTTLNAGTMVLSNSSALGTGGLTFGGSSTLSTLAPVTFGSISLGSGATGTINNNSNNLTFGGAISGSGGMVLNGGGTLTYTAANSYTGPTTLNGQTAIFSKNNPFGSGTLTVATSSLLSNASTVASANITVGSPASIGSGQTLTINSGSSASPTTNPSQVTLSAPISGSGALSLIASPTNWFTITSGSPIGNPTGNSYSGGTTLSNGVVQFYGTATPFGSGTVTIAGSASVRNIAQTGPIANAFAINSGQTLTLTNPAQGTPTYSGVISGAGNLNASSQTSGDSVALSASNTYSGTTFISSGTLILGSSASINASTNINLGTAASQGKLDVSSQVIYALTTNQTLSGYGLVNVGSGGLTANGNITPGSIDGTTRGLIKITGTGGLALSAATTTSLTISGTNGVAGTDYDAVQVTNGALTYNGTLNITINQPPIGTFDLFSANTFLGNFTNVALSGSWNSGAFTAIGNIWTYTSPDEITLTFTPSTGLLEAVPEPSTWALLGVGLLLGCVLRRRMIRKEASLS